MKFYPVRFGFLLAFACFVSITWITSVPSDEGPALQPALQMLYQRLVVAEELGSEISRDLRGILETLRNTTIANVAHSNTTEPMRQQGGTGQQISPKILLQLPAIYFYLPHLRQHPDSLQPLVVLGQGRRGVSIVMGIPTVKREKQSYLVNTISSLLYSLTSSQQQDLLIIVFVAETDSDYVSSIAETIKNKFPKEVTSGLLEVVAPSQYYYPDFTSLTETFGDSVERVKWRTKQNLDFSLLMVYAQDKGTYYVQLEDDVVATVGYYDDMKAFANREASKQWLYLEFSQLGFIGKMFRTRDLPMFAEFFLMFHRDKPIDWLLDHILWVKVCNPEKDAKHCNEQKALLKQRHKPSLFQHVGLHSSLAGKIQNLKDKDFGKQILNRAHSNPVAELSTSMTHYHQNSLDRAYQGKDFFWALTPIQNDYILFKFPKPIHISSYLFRSGNIESSSDTFHNTTVEVLSSKVSALAALSPVYKESNNGFFIIGAFKDGVAEGRIDESLQPISALQLVVQSDANVWAVLSEIFIQV